MTPAADVIGVLAGQRRCHFEGDGAIVTQVQHLRPGPALHQVGAVPGDRGEPG